MASPKQPLIVAVLLIAVGSGWLLNNLEFVPGVNWIWTLCLGLIGITWLAIGGIDKLTAVIGPLLISASALSYLRQTNRLDERHEMPGLMVLLGVLIAISCCRCVPVPRWFHRAGQSASTRNDAE